MVDVAGAVLMRREVQQARAATDTAFKLEFWSRISGKDRKHRTRYYKSVPSMRAAGARWEARDPEYWCRYWNGLFTWVSEKRKEQ